MASPALVRTSHGVTGRKTSGEIRHRNAKVAGGISVNYHRVAQRFLHSHQLGEIYLSGYRSEIRVGVGRGHFLMVWPIHTFDVTGRDPVRPDRGQSPT